MPSLLAMFLFINDKQNSMSIKHHLLRATIAWSLRTFAGAAVLLCAGSVFGQSDPSIEAVDSLGGIHTLNYTGALCDTGALCVSDHCDTVACDTDDCDSTGCDSTGCDAAGSANCSDTSQIITLRDLPDDYHSSSSIAFRHNILAEEPPHWARLIEFAPTLLSKPVEPLGDAVGHLLHLEHDHVKTELDCIPIGIQPIPERPALLVELNEEFLAPGFLNQGVETRSGAVLRPSFWVFGQYRTSMHYFERDRAIDPVVENVHRLDLFGQLNLSGTERLVVGMRPLDEENGGAREFTGYDFSNGNSLDGWNARFQSLFFEGDLGEIFPGLDFYDTRGLDIGFSAGRMPLLAQQGLLINEDMIDAVTVTRNTINGRGILNLRATGVFAWHGINRNSAVGRANDYDTDSKLYAFLTETDLAATTINLDGVYVDSSSGFGDMYAFGASGIARHHLFENTYNTSMHVLASFPGGQQTDYADQGELLFAQTSWTPHHTEDLVYLNSYWAIDQFTSPARGPANGSALGQTGILFSGIALGSYAAPIAASTDNTAGASLGYQFFFDHTRAQLIWEVGGVKETKGISRGALGTGFRFQKACGQHVIAIVDAFASKREADGYAQGARFEVLTKF